MNKDTLYDRLTEPERREIIEWFQEAGHILHSKDEWTLEDNSNTTEELYNLWNKYQTKEAPLTSPPRIKVRIGACQGGNDQANFEGWALYAHPEDNPHLPESEHGVHYVSPSPDGIQDCEAFMVEHDLYDLVEEADGVTDEKWRPARVTVRVEGRDDTIVLQGVDLSHMRPDDLDWADHVNISGAMEEEGIDEAYDVVLIQPELMDTDPSLLDCNTCGNTGQWESTTEDAPETLVSLGPCPDCHRGSPEDQGAAAMTDNDSDTRTLTADQVLMVLLGKHSGPVATWNAQGDLIVGVFPQEDTYESIKYDVYERATHKHMLTHHHAPLPTNDD